MFLCSMGRVLWVRNQFGVPLSRWFTAVILPCSIVACSSLVAAWMVYWMMTPSFLRLVLVSIISGVLSAITTWFFALNQAEQDFFRQNIRLLFNKLNVLLPRIRAEKSVE